VDEVSAVTPRLHVAAFTPVPRRALRFTPVQISMGLEPAHSRAPKRNRAHLSSMRRRRNYRLAKVGVEGSNPFARSKFEAPGDEELGVASGK
jgi:hypothetical protein